MCGEELIGTLSARRHSQPSSNRTGRRWTKVAGKTRRPENAIVLSLLLLMSGAPLVTDATPTAIPGTAEHAEDSVHEFAIAVDDEGVLHVVWKEGSSQDLRYVTGDCRRGAWSTPVTLLPRAHGPMRLLADGSNLYLLIGPRLSLLVSTDRGGSWKNIGTIIDEGPPASALDAMLAHDLMIVAYAVPPQHPGAYAEPAPELLRVALNSIASIGSGESQLVAYAPGPLSELPALPVRGPVLSRSGDVLHLIYAVNVRRSQLELGHMGQPIAVDSVSGHVFELKSTDKGFTWNAPQSVIAESPFPGSPAVEALAVRPSAHGLEVFVVAPSALGLRRIRQLPGVGWSEPEPVVPRPHNSLGPAFKVGDVSVAVTDDSAILVWSDTRNRTTTRRIWSPLGGFPWSDDPDGAENDVFAMPLNDLPSETGARAVVRITSPGGYAENLRVASGPTQAFLVWSGPARVGPRQARVNSARELLCTVLTSSPASPHFIDRQH